MSKDKALDIVLSEFLELAKVPRPSHHEERVSEYLFQWAKRHGLAVEKDNMNEIIIDKPATPGCENVPRVIFQAHMDMVCVCEEGVTYGYHHSTDDGKYLIMGNGTQAFAIAAEQREQENYMRTAELSTEQNYNMIDGQINNTPSVDELEEKAKRGEVISLSALAAAVKAEDGRTPQRDPDGKKPSIRAQLKADRAQSCKPQQREKEQEAKRSIRQALEME